MPNPTKNLRKKMRDELRERVGFAVTIKHTVDNAEVETQGQLAAASAESVCVHLFDADGTLTGADVIEYSAITDWSPAGTSAKKPPIEV